MGLHQQKQCAAVCESVLYFPKANSQCEALALHSFVELCCVLARNVSVVSGSDWTSGHLTFHYLILVPDS